MESGRVMPWSPESLVGQRREFCEMAFGLGKDAAAVAEADGNRTRQVLA